jgi:hypothetical protein
LAELSKTEEPEALPEVWQPPPEEECQEEQVYDSPVGEPDDILRFRILLDLHDNLVDFSIILMTGPGEAKREVARADIRHTGLHVHWFRQDGTQLRRQELMLVRTLPEVQQAYVEALDRVMDNLAEYKRRWRHG